MSGLSLMERIIVFGVCAMLAVFTGLTFTTAGWWLRLDRLTIADACVGDSPTIIYDRTYHRAFHGDWLVSLWYLDDDGDWAAWDSEPGQWDYEPSRKVLDRDMEWLVAGDPRMSRPPVNKWRVDVAVTANPGTIFSRTAKVSSNVFEIRSCSN